MSSATLHALGSVGTAARHDQISVGVDASIEHCGTIRCGDAVRRAA
jgi:hypothetical protein